MPTPHQRPSIDDLFASLGEADAQPVLNAAVDGWTCPGCGRQVVAGQEFDHADNCVTALAAEKVSAADREWGEAHPFAVFRRRPADPAELAIVPGGLGCDNPAHWHVIVQYCSDENIRFRQFVHETAFDNAGGWS